MNSSIKHQVRKNRSKDNLNPSRLTLNEDISQHLQDNLSMPSETLIIPNSTQSRFRADLEQIQQKSQLLEKIIGKKKVSQSKPVLGSVELKGSNQLLNIKTSLPLKDEQSRNNMLELNKLSSNIFSSDMDKMSLIPQIIDELQIKTINQERSDQRNKTISFDDKIKRKDKKVKSDSRSRIQYKQIRPQLLTLDSFENSIPNQNQIPEIVTSSRNNPNLQINSHKHHKRFISLENNATQLRTTKNATTTSNDYDDQLHFQTVDYRSNRSREKNNGSIKLPQMNIQLQDKPLQLLQDSTLQNIRIKSLTTRNQNNINNTTMMETSQDQSQHTQTQNFEDLSTYNKMHFKDMRREKNATQIWQNKLVDENFRDLSISLNKYLKDKMNNNSVTNREQKEQRRTVRNTYQLDKLRQQSLSTTQRDTTDQSFNKSSNEVRPRSLIKIPKDIILYQISKKTNRDVVKEVLNHSLANNQQSNLKPKQQQSYLDFLEKGVIEQDSRQSSLKEQQEEIKTDYKEVLSNLTTKRLDQSRNQIPNKSTLNRAGNDESKLSYHDQVMGFHITDLLESTFKDGPNSDSKYFLRNLTLIIENNQIIQYYKRTVKFNGDLDKNKEIMIKNYRLHVVSDESDISQYQRQILGVNAGTSIYVSNSIIQPETFKFSTKISNQIPQNLILQEFSAQNTKQRKESTKINEEQALNTFMTQFNMNFNSEDLREIQMLENQYFDHETSMIIAEDEFERDSIEDSNYQQQIIQTFQKNLQKWFNNGNDQAKEISTKTSPLKKKGLTKAEQNQYSPRIRDIQNSMLKNKDGNIENQFLIPQSDYVPNSYLQYDSMQMTKVNQSIGEQYQDFIKSTMSVNVISHKNQSKTQNLQTLNFLDCKKAINSINKELSHLDDLVFRAENFSPELFVNFSKWIDTLVSDVKKWQMLQSKNIKTRNIMAETEYFQTDGTSNVIDVKIIDYDPQSAKFLVQNEKLNVKTWRSRLFMKLKNESQQVVQKLRDKVIKYMQQTKEFLRVHKIILEQLCVKYDYVKMPDQFRNNIKKMMKVDQDKCNRDTLTKLIVQVEALFVFSIFKSILSSQINDPNIRSMLLKRKINLDSEAIFPYIPQVKDKFQLQGLKDFSMKETKIELDKNSLLLMDKKYIQLPIFLNKVTSETINIHTLFKFPFDINLLQSNGGDSFKQLSQQDLTGKVNTFPLHHKYFIIAQKVISEHFHTVARYRWSEMIYQEVWNFVKDDFEYETGKKIGEDQVDPVLRRLFYQLKLYMQTVLFDHFERALADFLEFLLSFLMRDPDFHISQLSQQIQSSNKIKLSNTQTFYSNKNANSIINDLQLIKLRDKPFIFVQAVILNKATNKYYTQMESSTKPELDKIKKDLMSIVYSMYESLKNIERVDKLVFPLLKLEYPCLNPPDIRNNDKLKFYIRTIENAIDEGLGKSYDKMVEIDKFVAIFEKKPENIIIELKKRTFAMQNEQENEEQLSKQGSLNSLSQISSDSEDQSPNIYKHKTSMLPTLENASKGSQNQQETMQKQQLMQQQQQQILQQPQNLAIIIGPDVAFRSVEIDDSLFEDELDRLNGMYWQIKESIHNQYDFGFVLMDCMPFKEKILKHLKSLIDHLVSYSKKEFLNKLNSIQNDVNSVQNKLEESVYSIDDVILLLDYIDQIKKPGNKVEELSQQISDLKLRMQFIFAIQVQLKTEDFMQYLNILNWPRTFIAYLEKRKVELQRAKDNLFYEMGNEKDMIFQKIEEFKASINLIKNEGLIKLSELDKIKQTAFTQEELISPTFRRKRIIMKQTFNHQINQESIQQEISPLTVIKPQPNPIQASQDNISQSRLQKDAAVQTFKFISAEISWDDYRFEPEVIEEVYDMTDNLKVEYDSIEKLTAQINKRETLLGVDKTEFKELRVILDDIKPLYELWIIANKFSKTFPVWMEGRFDSLDSEQIENSVNDWVNELKRLSKNPFLKQSLKQIELLSFIYQALNQFKTYLPLLKALRTKGLALRHWRMIGNKLDFVVDPSTVTLRKLINFKLYEVDKISIIKSICEIATKEYAVMTSLETLDRDIKALEFSLQPYKEKPLALQTIQIPITTQTNAANLSQNPQSDEIPFIVLRLQELIMTFDEYSMRVSVLKTNPYIKNFFDKMMEIERIVKHVVEILNEWQYFQKNWLYLEGIFSLEEISRHLEREYKKFQGVDAYYKTVSKSFEATPQVYRACQREAFLMHLQRYNYDCELIIQALNQFLELKREKFPRLFFLSNEEMIEIFGKNNQSTENEESKIQAHSLTYLSKLFEGVENVNINQDEEIFELISKENEILRLIKPVSTENSTPEKWLQDLERQMQNSLRFNILMAYETFEKIRFDKWLQQWPSQCLYTSTQIWFCKQIDQMFANHQEIQKKEQQNGTPLLSQRTNQNEEQLASGNQTALLSPREPDSPTISRNMNQNKNQKYFKESVFLEDIVDKRILKHVQKQLDKLGDIEQNLSQTFSFQMKMFLDKLKDLISQLSLMTKTQLDINQRQTVINMIALFVHLRDQQQSLIDNKISKAEEFQWQMTLKFQFKNLVQNVTIKYIKNEEEKTERMKIDTQKLDITMQVFSSQRLYGFEYLGNSNRLIITPLTERCQRSLLIALHYFYGGAPEGPVGTGKTETTKDLAKQLAKLCFVLNCSSNFDYQSVLRFFKGITSSGSWVCFDEFNRMDPHILSIISQVIISIQSAIRKQSPSLMIDEAKVQLKQDCAIFITLNPLYAGRTELPLNLKNLFRPISMVVPDYSLITEILLFCSGFKNAQKLSKQLVNIQESTDILINQEEFKNDFGLRSIKAIISYAELLKLQSLGLKENDLTFLIDDSHLQKIPTKSFEVIRDFYQNQQVQYQRNKANESELKILDQYEDINEDLEDNNDYSSDANLMGSSITLSSGQGMRNKSRVRRRDGVLNKRKAQNQMLTTGFLFEKIYGFGTDLKMINKENFYKQLGIELKNGELQEDDLEELIVMAAIKDYNKTKLSKEDNQIFDHILRDTFKSEQAIQSLGQNTQINDNLMKCIKQSLEEKQQDMPEVLIKSVCQLYEISQVKHGIIIVGKAQTGKSTVIQTLKDSLNKSSQNELDLLVLQQRKTRLKEIAKDIDELNRTRGSFKRQGTQKMRQSQLSVNSYASDSIQRKQFMGQESMTQNAKNILSEVYKKTKLTEQELAELQNQLMIQEVISQQINPKSMEMTELFGSFEDETHSWIEGIFPKIFRDFATSLSKKRKWIIFDGPIDSLWVENLNSILDDNKKMSLANGESVFMSTYMTIMLETDNLTNTTPATVSRCGLIYLQPHTLVKPKMLFNSWLRKLPNILKEYQSEIEAQACSLLKIAFKVFDSNKERNNLIYSQINQLWIIKTFLSLLESLISDYREYDNKMENKNNPRLLEEQTKRETIKINDQGIDSNLITQVQSKIALSSVKSDIQLNSTQDIGNIKSTQRHPMNRFMIDEIRQENAIKFIPIWIEAAILTAVIWSFGSILNETGKRELDQEIKDLLIQYKSDFATYQKIKKKNQQQQMTLNTQENQDSKKIIKESKMEESPDHNKDLSTPRIIANQNLENQFSLDFDDFISNEILFISEFPVTQQQSIFEVYFSFDQSNWQKFNVERDINSAIVQYHNLPDSIKRVQNIYVPTNETIKYQYLLECYATQNISTILIGASANGKTSLIRDHLFIQAFQFSNKFMLDHLTFSSSTKSDMVKKTMERKLEQYTEDGTRYLRPTKDKHLIIYIDDIHMPSMDQYGQQSANELLRDYFKFGGWHQCSTKNFRKVQDVTIFTVLSTISNAFSQYGGSGNSQRPQVTERLLHNFALIGLDDMKRSTVKSLFQIITGLIALQWPSEMQQNQSRVISYILEIYTNIQDNLKQTPMKVHYQFNMKDLLKVCNGLMLVESNYLKNQENLMKLVYHECLRVYGDKIIIDKDQQWLSERLKELAYKHFEINTPAKSENTSRQSSQLQKVRKQSTIRDKSQNSAISEPEFPIKDQQNLYFSIFNQEVEGYYVEIDSMAKVQEIIEKMLFKYNDSTERQHMNLILFTDINKVLFKMLRIMSTSNGHMLLIAQKGSGITPLQKLASFALGFYHKNLELIPGFTIDEWRGELQKLLVKAGQEDKPVVLSVDQFSIQFDQQYDDLQCILNNNISSDVMSPQEIDQSLSFIHQQFEMERIEKINKSLNILNSSRVGDSSNNAELSKNKKQNLMSQFQTSGLYQILQQPDLQAQLYSYFLKRVKHNFHIILTYSPSGENFKQKLLKHQSFLSNCTVVWLQDFSDQALEDLGQHFIEYSEQHDLGKHNGDQQKDSFLYQQELEIVKGKQENDVVNKKVLQSCIKMFQDSKDMAKKFHSQTDQVMYFTTSHFLGMFLNYKRLYDERRKNVTDIQKRYENGLERIRVTQIAIQEYHLELESKLPLIQEKQKSLISLIEEIEQQFLQIKKDRDVLKREEFLIQKDCDDAFQIKLTCEQGLNKVAPALNEAVNSIQSLSKHDLSELRAMKKPPKVIKLVLKNVCILLQVQPQRKKSKDGIHFKDSYWAAAQSKDVLGNVRLPDLLIEYDRNKISQGMMIEIENVLSDSDYTYENAYRASKAATGMFKWVKAIRDYYYIFQEIEPRRDAFMLSEKQHSIKQEELQAKRKELFLLEDRLKVLQEQLDQKDQEIEELKIQIQDCKTRKKRADTLLKGLSSEKQKWIVCTRMLASKYLTVTGDVLLSSAFISLLSGFTQKYRNKLIKKWKNLLNDNGLPVSDNFNFNDLFGDQMKIRAWQLKGLPSDQPSINNAIIMEKSKKYCICIDYQYQAMNWLKNQYYDQGLINLKYGDQHFKKSLEIAIEMGKPVMVDNIEDKIDITLYSLLQKEIIKHGNQRLINFCRKTFKFDKNFDLFLVSHAKSPHFDVHVSNLTTMVNFYVTFDGLQQQLLSLVVANERQDLEERFVENTKEAFENIKGLKDIENAILSQLNVDINQLLANDVLIKTLNQSRTTAELIAMKLKTINQSSQFMQKSRDLFSPVSKRASLLYFVIADLSKINHMYQFSLSWFTKLFLKSMQITNQLRPNEDMKQLNQSVKSSIAFTKKKFSQAERIDLLINTFTQELYKKVCASIYDQDRMLVTYLMTFRVLEFEEYLDKNLYQFLLMGPKVQQDKQENTDEFSQHKISWLNQKNYSDLKILSTLNPFTQQNLIDSLKDNSQEWNDYYELSQYSFDDLPNKSKLNLAPMLPQLHDDRQDNSGMLNEIANQSVEERNNQDTDDDNNRLLTRNVSSVLNDEELWRVSSDSEDEEQQINKYNYRKQNLGGGLDEDENQFLNEEEEMAQYMLETTPQMVSQYNQNDQKQTDFIKQTKQEYEMRAKKELVLKSLVELCVLRCIRPDKINESINKFLQVVINTEYTSFSQDILTTYQNTNQNKAKLSSAAKLKQTSQPKTKVSNFIGLLKEAYDESSKSTPIFFLITHSVHVYAILNDLQKAYPDYHQTKLQYLSLGRGLEKKVEDKITKAAQAGDWLLLENLHLVIEWLPKLEEIIMKLDRNEVNSKFRLWLSSVSVNNFPANILQLSIKVALQPPRQYFSLSQINFSGLKPIMDRMLNQSQEMFRKSKKNMNLHKNLFFGLVYFHSVLVGRKKYGTLGWNVPYEFDFSDFEISASQMQSQLRRNIVDDETNLKMMRYFIGEINYAGKIQRNEDKKILDALINDLFSTEISISQTELGANISQSHYGFPTLDSYIQDTNESFEEFIKTLPDNDDEEIFGFNHSINRLHQKKMIFEVFMKVNELNTKNVSYNNPLDIKVKDLNDVKVKEVALNIMKSLPQQFSQEMLNSKFPITYEDSFTSLIQKEVFKYNCLLQTLRNLILDLISTIDGKLEQTKEMEKLWQDILLNQVSSIWLSASYSTCITSLSDYLINLNERISFLKNWIENGQAQEPVSFDFEKSGNQKNGGLTCFWFPGFFDQRSFLITLLQKKARQDQISIDEVENIFEVMKYKDSKKCIIRHENTTYLSGFWLEGASWDLKKQILVESTSQELYSQFPIIRVTTVNKNNLLRQGASVQNVVESHEYECPVFKTTMRLSNNNQIIENEPLMFVNLRTQDNTQKWIKRSVALVLDIKS